MNLNELEKDLRDYREGPQEKINTDKLWNRVSPHIPQSKNNNYKFISLLLFPFLLLTGVIFWYLISNSTISDKDIALAINQRSGEYKVTSIQVENTDLENDANKSISEVRKNNQLFYGEPNSRFTVNDYSTDVGQRNGKTEAKADWINLQNNTVNNSFSNSTSNEFVQQTIFGELIDNKQITLNLHNATNGSINNIVSSDRQEANLFSRDENKIINTSGKADQPNIIKAAIGGDKESLDIIIGDNFEINKEQRALYNLKPLPLQSLIVFGNNIPTPPSLIEPIAKSVCTKISIDIGGGYYFPSRSLSLENPEFANAITNRSNSEELLESWQSSVALRYMVTSHIGVSVGVNYLVINERSNTEISLTELISIQDVAIGDFVRLDGSVEPLFGDVDLAQTTIRRVSRVNTFTLIQIPIEVFYKHRINQLTIEVGGGLIPNASSTAAGFWHPDNETEYDFSKDENDYLSNRINVSFTGRAGLSYPLTNKLDVYSNIRFIASLKGFENENYGIKQSYNLFGIELGLRINL